MLELGHNKCFPDTELNAWVETQQVVPDIKRLMLMLGNNKCFRDTEVNACV